MFITSIICLVGACGGVFLALLDYPKEIGASDAALAVFFFGLALIIAIKSNND
jgi:hypothetical protein